ncbi:MAG: xanthine dehydrogenase family protein subunit M, partial [Paracoccaceae bacterium]
MKSKVPLGYFRADSVADALDALQQDSVSVIAGGTDWYPGLGDAPAPANILDVSAVPEFQGVTRQQNGWRIGAATTWSDLISADLPDAFDGLKLAARDVGSVQIQNVATLVGNICNASPAADGVPPLLCLDAQVEIVSHSGTRLLPLAEFITGVRTTA